MKKKIHIALVVIIAGLFIIPSLYSIFSSNNLFTINFWDKRVNKLGGEKVSNAKEFVKHFHKYRIDGLQDKMHPEALSQLISLEQHPTIKYFNSHAPCNVWSIGYNSSNSSGNTVRKYFFQYDYTEKPNELLMPFFKREFSQDKEPYSLLISLEEEKNQNSSWITSFSIRPLTSLEKKDRLFSFEGKSTFQMLFFICFLLVPLFVLFSLIQFIRMPIACQKTSWLIFIAVGITCFSLNWATGKISFEPITIMLVGSGFSKVGIYLPWMFNISIPLGAILFLFKRKKWIVKHQEKQNEAII